MISLGIIGAGIMGRRMLGAATEQAADVVRIAGIWDPSPAALADLPDITKHPSAAALIAASDCVYIASPPASHLAHADAALAAGKAVFCEKPLAVDVTAASAFVAGAAGARAAVNFPMASSLGVAKLREWLGAGIIGTPTRLDISVAFATWPRGWQHGAAKWLDAPAEGGFTREVVSHFLFLTRRLCGPLHLLAGHASFPEPGRSERKLEARLEAGGIPVTLSGSVGTTKAEDQNTWTLTGTKGSLRLRDWSIAERLIGDTWQPDPGAMPNNRMRPLVLRRQLEGVTRMTTNTPHHLATLAEALEVQQTVELMLR
jgi:predicted dehydrogenase